MRGLWWLLVNEGSVNRVLRVSEGFRRFVRFSEGQGSILKGSK